MEPRHYHRKYDLDADPHTYLRNRFTTLGPTLLRYTVQLEVVYDGKVYPIVRYDDAHGMAHRDTLDADGRVVEKLWIKRDSIKLAHNEAITDLKAHWRRYRDAFERTYR